MYLYLKILNLNTNFKNKDSLFANNFKALDYFRCLSFNSLIGSTSLLLAISMVNLKSKKIFK